MIPLLLSFLFLITSSISSRHPIHATLLEMDSSLALRMKGCKSQLSQMCNPCFKAPLAPDCEKWKDQCLINSCFPMCTRLTWDVKVKPKSCSGNEACGQFMDEIKQESYQLALKTHLLAHGCAHVLQCCPDDENLENWLEQRVYNGFFPVPRLPMPACGEGSSELCSMCKSAVGISLSAKNICSEFPEVKTPPPSSLEANFGHSLTPRAEQLPKHKSYKKKCKKIAKYVKLKLTMMKMTFKESVCKCLGCCKADANKPCFFNSPVYPDIKSAVNDK